MHLSSLHQSTKLFFSQQLWTTKTLRTNYLQFSMINRQIPFQSANYKLRLTSCKKKLTTARWYNLFAKKSTTKTSRIVLYQKIKKKSIYIFNSWARSLNNLHFKMEEVSSCSKYTMSKILRTIYIYHSIYHLSKLSKHFTIPICIK